MSACTRLISPHLLPAGRAVLFLALGLLVPPPLAEAAFPAFQPALAGIGAGSQGSGSVPSIQAVALNGSPIEVDGRLDDEAWSECQAGSGFRVWDPDRGAAPSETTLFRVAYDKEALYVGVACFEQDPEAIRSKLSRRDRLSETDLVSVYLDPYHDQISGYSFEVNPEGVQKDAYIYNDGERDDGWDAVWQAETYKDPDGWYAEMRIPFSSIRYRADAPKWGFQVQRRMHSRGEQNAWVVWDMDTPGFVSRFGHLSGLRGIPAPRQLEILPYALYRGTDPAVRGREEVHTFQNFGLDLKYGLTSDLTLNATFQPDFGQVEADPAVLNLSPFETFFDEKRPFFVEGSRFFQHPTFNLFYSRRIGTGDETSRIRFAGKLTGKTSSGISLAALGAATDLTQSGQTHNFVKSGTRPERFFVSRIGKEFDHGQHQVNFMQTAVLRPGSRAVYGNLGSREAYTSGADFQLQFKDRAYAVSGSFVGSIVIPEPDPARPADHAASVYGTGGTLNLHRNGGFWRGSVTGRWESDRLGINDLGFLNSPDEIFAGGNLSRVLRPSAGKGLINNGNFNWNVNLSWLYGGRTGRDLHTLEKVWSYSPGHVQFPNTNVNGWVQLRNFWEVNGGLQYNWLGTQRYFTRDTVLLQDGRRAAVPGGGPLISEPATYGGWWGLASDKRRELLFELSGSHFFDTAKNASNELDAGVTWNQSSAMAHQLSLGYHDNIDDTQHLDNFENLHGGIGGVSFVFGRIHQRTADVTLRTNLLFSRNSSLEFYLQPFMTVGSFGMGRELSIPDTYRLTPYEAEGFNVKDYDFRFASVNVNAVYRWEYRPGSTFFLVWTHSRASYEERSSVSNPSAFRSSLDGATLFRNEPENVLLAKITYWIPV